MAPLTLDQPPPRPAHDMGHQIGDIWNITLCLKKFGFWVSWLFHPTLGHWFPNEKQTLFSFLKKDFGPLRSTRVLVVTLDALTKVLESTFLDSPLEGAAIPIDYTFVSYHAFLFQSTFHYHALIGTLWTASLFGNDLLWSWSFATGVNYFNQLLKFGMFDCAYWHRVFYNKVGRCICVISVSSLFVTRDGAGQTALDCKVLHCAYGTA